MNNGSEHLRERQPCPDRVVLCRAELDDGRRCIYVLSTTDGHPGYPHVYETHAPRKDGGSQR